MEIGALLGEQYRVVQNLGQGDFASTYFAEPVRGGARVVVKRASLKEIVSRRNRAETMSLSEPSAFKLLELFKREARVLSQLDHPNIPRFVDFFTIEKPDDVELYLVQQHIKGRNLAELTASGRHFSEKQIRDLAVRVARVLEYLHDLRPPIVHRDIKPSNLLLRDDGELFLVDFGVIKHEVGRELLGDATIVGTLGYMPLEQFHGAASPASDVYALGATLVYLLTHRSPADVPQRGLRPDFRALVEVSKPFAALLDRMLEPNAADRIRNGHALRLALQGGPPQETTAKNAASTSQAVTAPAAATSRRPVAMYALAGLLALGGLRFLVTGRDDMVSGKPSPSTPPYSINTCDVEEAIWRPTPDVLAQSRIVWAKAVVDSSDDSGSVAALLGPPDHARGSNDGRTWSARLGPSVEGVTDSWATVTFGGPVTARAVVVAEASAAGALKRIELDDGTGNNNDCILWRGRRSDPARMPRMLRLDFDGQRIVHQVRVYLDASESNPLDAVGLIVDAPAEPFEVRERVASQASAWESAATDLATAKPVWAEAILTRDQEHDDYGTAPGILGKADVWPEHGSETKKAWSIAQFPRGRRWIVLSFGKVARAARSILVFENDHPGAVARIEDVSNTDPKDLANLDRPIVLWEGYLRLPEVNAYPCHGEHSRVLRIDLPEPRNLSAIRIVVHTDQSCYSEIDAVALLE